MQNAVILKKKRAVVAITGASGIICALRLLKILMDNKTGCRFLTVDAYADAIPFYIKNGFVPLNEEDAGAVTRLLYFDLATIADDELDD